MRISDWSSDVCSSDLDHRKPERPAREIFLGAMLDRADVLARHRAADHLVDEFKAPAARQRPDLDVHIAELAVPAGLALERKRVVEGKSVSVRVDIGRRRLIKKKKCESQVVSVH